MRKEDYYLTVVEFIAINGISSNSEDINEVCRCFLKENS